VGSTYQYVLDGDVLEEFLRRSIRQREKLLTVFRLLADNPFQRGEFCFRDSTSREIQRNRFGDWTISFWSDHAVKEVRIVGIQRIKR
jgi:hypothetical protein